MRRLSIRAKLFVAFTLCVNLIIGLLSYLYYQQTSKVIWERNREATQQMMFRFGSSVTQIVKDIDRISAQILYDPEINAYFDDPEPAFDNSYPTFVKLKKLTTLLQNFNGPALTANKIIVLNRNGNYIDYGLNWDTFENLKDRLPLATWIEPTMAKAGDKVLVPPRPTEWQTTGELVFSVARQLNRDTLIEVQQPYSLLENAITEGLSSASAASIYVFDDAGRVFYPYGISRIPFNADRNIADADGVEVVNSDTGEINLINLSHSTYSGLNIALLQPKHVLLKPIREMQIVSYFVIGAAELLAVLLSYWIARTITTPIFKLQRFVRKVELENAPATSPPAEFSYSGEVNELYETFVKMTTGLRGSMNEIIDLQNRENLAQMQALYAQMNPHFLYNTLTSIGRSAEEADNPAVAQMCYKLTGLMRYGTLSISAPVTAQEELKHAVAYLELMKLRYEHQFVFETELDPALAGESVPKLILQPFLENCFTHGFQKVEPPWTLSLAIRECPDVPNRWSIVIADNGAGFGEESLMRLRETIDALHAGRPLEPQRITSRGLGNVGVENTLTRCRMFWNDRVRFGVRNLREGAEIRIEVDK